MIPRPDWHLEAACRAHPEPDLWHGDATGKTGHRMTARAKAVCSTCPVELRCLAVHFFEPHGIWGGMTEDERRALRRGQRTPAPTTTPKTQPKPRRRRTLAPIAHGTNNGYHAHLKRNEPPCEDCRRAHSDYTTARRLARKSA